jgi:hypothetical protein
VGGRFILVSNAAVAWQDLSRFLGHYEPRDVFTMTTTVLIRKSRSYLPRLKQVMCLIGTRLGMSNADIEDTEAAVSEICLGSIETAVDQNEGLEITFCAEDSCLIVDIDDSSTGRCLADSTPPPAESGIWDGLERAWHLADDVKVITRGDNRIIRLVKRAHRLPTIPAAETCQTSVRQTTGVLV